MMSKKRSRKGARLILALSALALAFGGCLPAAWQTKTKGKDTTKEPPVFFVHKVQWEGESLSIIAKWYTGHMRNWKLLVRGNPTDDPNRIRIGEEISIPERILKTREPLPESFVDRFGPRPKTPEKEKPPPAIPKEEPPELFGPKEYETPHSKREEEDPKHRTDFSGLHAACGVQSGRGAECNRCFSRRPSFPLGVVMTGMECVAKGSVSAFTTPGAA